MNITDEDLAAYCELFDLDPTEINVEGHRRDLEVFSRHRMTTRRKALEDAAKVADGVVQDARMGEVDSDLRCIASVIDQRIRAMIEGENE